MNHLRSHKISNTTLFYLGVGLLTLVLLWMFINTMLHTYYAAHLPDGVSVAITSAQTSYPQNTSQKVAIKITPNNAQYKISAFNLVLKSTGTLQFESATVPTAFPDANQKLFHEVSANAARLAYVVGPSGAPVSNIEFEVTIKGAAGTGTITVDQVASEVVGTLPGYGFKFDDVSSPSYTFTGTGGNGTNTTKATMTYTPAALSMSVGEEKPITIRIDASALTKKIAGIDLALAATGKAQFTKIGPVQTGFAEIAPPSAVAATTARIVHVAEAVTGATLPSAYEFQIFVKGAEAGEGSITVTKILVSDLDGFAIEVAQPTAPAISIQSVGTGVTNPPPPGVGTTNPPPPGVGTTNPPPPTPSTCSSGVTATIDGQSVLFKNSNSDKNCTVSAVSYVRTGNTKFPQTRVVLNTGTVAANGQLTLSFGSNACIQKDAIHGSDAPETLTEDYFRPAGTLIEADDTGLWLPGCGPSANARTTKVLVEVHSAVGSSNDEDKRWDGWFGVFLNDGTALVPWVNTGYMNPLEISVPSNQTARLYWRLDKNDESNPPYIIDPNLCVSSGVWALTEEYRTIHTNVPETPRDAGRRSIGAYCS